MHDTNAIEASSYFCRVRCIYEVLRKIVEGAPFDQVQVILLSAVK